MDDRLYEIRLKGYLKTDWADRFEGVTIRHEWSAKGRSIVTVLSVGTDQPELHTVLTEVHETAFPLISLSLVDE